MGVLEPPAPGDQPLAVQVHHQQAAGVQFVPELTVAADHLVEVVPQARGLFRGDLGEPAVDGTLVGEASAQSLLEGPIGPDPGVARRDATQATSESGEDSSDPPVGGVGGGAAGRMAETESPPERGQFEDVGEVKDVFGEDNAASATGRWSRDGVWDRIHEGLRSR